MSKIEEVRSAMVSAMKAGDKETKESLSLLLSALKNKRADLTPEEETQVILKEIKQTKETLELAPADRSDIVEECQKRIAVLEQFAPKMMSEEEIRGVIKEVLASLALETPTAKDKDYERTDAESKRKGRWKACK